MPRACRLSKEVWRAVSSFLIRAVTFDCTVLSRLAAAVMDPAFATSRKTSKSGSMRESISHHLKRWLAWKQIIIRQPQFPAYCVYGKCVSSFADPHRRPVSLEYRRRSSEDLRESAVDERCRARGPSTRSSPGHG